MNGLFRKAKHLPVIRQAEAAECGLACLAMILNWFGYRVDLNSLRFRVGSSAQGSTLKALIQLADRLHLSARPLRLEMTELQQMNLPAILHWDFKHFVVLKQVSTGYLLIHDPARGEVRVPWEQASGHFTGVALEIQPAQGFVARDERKSLRLTDLWQHSEGLTGSFLQLLLFSLVLQVLSLALPFYTQLFIDDVLVNQDFALLKIMAVGFFMVTVVRCLVEFLRARTVLYLANSIGYQFASNVCRHLLRLPLQWFSRRHPGDVLSRFGSLNQLKDFLCSGLVEVVIDGAMVAGTLSLMWLYSPSLTLVTLLAVVVYVALRCVLHQRFRRHNEEVLQAAALENSNFLENLRAIQGIRLHGKEAERLGLWQNLHADLINAGVRVQNLGTGLRLANGLLLGIENIVLMLLGGMAVLNNQISIGMIMAYLSFKDQFYARVFALVDKLFEFRMLELHLERLSDIALYPRESHMDGVGAPPVEVCLQGGLALKGLGFRHDDNAPWLFRNVDLEVDTSEIVAVIGPTGCGKSTLMKVVASLLEPCEGLVSMHGVPVKAMGKLAYRERIAAVLQDDTLLSGSIFDNITFFDPQPDRERVELAAALASIANDIRVMPMQYNTLVGSMGAALSGGQVQRILLARAIYKRPRLLLLDEATSHLDIETEMAVNKAIKQLRIGRLVVAHRTETILQADRIVELTPEGLREVKHAELAARQSNQYWPARRLAV